MKPKFSLALTMAAVSLVAVDIAICRAIWWTSGPPLPIAVITLPMVNILLLTLPRVRSGSRLFWRGFQVAGWAAAIASGLACWLYEDPFLRPMEVFNRVVPLPNDAWGMVAVVAFAVVFYTTPQLVVAILVGRLVARYRFVIERRQES